MTISFAAFIQEIKKVRREDYFYLSMFLIFFILIFIVFTMAVSFFSGNMNKIFSSDSSETVRALDMEQYALVAKKLHFSIPTFNTNGELVSDLVAPPATTTQMIDKQSLVIKVLNGTKKSGLASSLSTALSAEGFLVIKTGNEEESYATTTLFLLESKKAYEQILMDALRKTYPSAIATTTDKNGGYDAIIIIGGQ